jgi:hypothetical protein
MRHKRSHIKYTTLEQTPDAERLLFFNAIIE